MFLRKACADAHNSLFLIWTNNCLSFVLYSSYLYACLKDIAGVIKIDCCFPDCAFSINFLGKPVLRKWPLRLFKALVAMNHPGSIRVYVFHTCIMRPMFEHCLYRALIIPSLKVIFQSGTWNVILRIVILKPQRKKLFKYRMFVNPHSHRTNVGLSASYDVACAILRRFSWLVSTQHVFVLWIDSQCSNTRRKYLCHKNSSSCPKRLLEAIDAKVKIFAELCRRRMYPTITVITVIAKH